MKVIDINADLGEGMGTDNDLLAIVSSASIACGGHAGNAESMRAALRAAAARNVTCGAHPGFLDRDHFGRRRLDLVPAELRAQMEIQLEAISGIAHEENVPLKFVKLHGALANMAAEDPTLAETVFAAVRAFDPDLAILALDNSAQVSAAESIGLRVVREAYADRAYTRTGLLVPRSTPGSVLTDPARVTEQCLRLCERGELVTIDGAVIRSEAISICLHADTPGAIALARSVRKALADAGISIRSPF